MPPSSAMSTGLIKSLLGVVSYTNALNECASLSLTHHQPAFPMCTILARKASTTYWSLICSVPR